MLQSSFAICVEHLDPFSIKSLAAREGGGAMDGNGYFGKVVEPERVYELGYERCTCPKVLSDQVTDPDLCNCSRQSILYILSRLEPSSDFEVEIIETVLRGAEHCRFRITKKQAVASKL